MHSGRLEAFSDGVLAILITIMVLELKVPRGADLAALRDILPVLCAYVLGFIYVGISRAARPCLRGYRAHAARCSASGGSESSTRSGRSYLPVLLRSLRQNPRPVVRYRAGRSPGAADPARGAPLGAGCAAWRGLRRLARVAPDRPPVQSPDLRAQS
jgi:hypothetical protein